MKTAILIFQSKDQKGIVAALSNFIFKNDANIISADQYSTDFENGYFFIRIEFCYNSKQISLEKIRSEFTQIAQKFSASWKIIDNCDSKLKMGILVSNEDHCLAELLYQWKSKELNVDIPFVISTTNQHQELVKSYHLPYLVISDEMVEQRETKILKATQNSDFLVLARFMKILSPQFLATYKKDIINIHHSFLPSFKGKNPYAQAYERGVKLIGATAHFVTAELDEGPIIEQKVEPVTHKDHIEALKSKGKHLERLALINAIKLYVDDRIIKFQNKTIIF